MKHLDYGGGSQKIKLTQWGSQILTSILTSQMMVTKNPQNVHRKYFWAILMTFISDIKIDVNMCEPHYVNLFFLWTSSIVQMFDFLTFGIFLTTWHLFDILTHQWNLNHLSPLRAIFYFPLPRLADFGTFWYCYNLWLLHVEAMFCFIEKLTTKDCHSLSPQKNHRIGFLFSCLFSFLSYWCVSMVQISITENLSGYFNIYTTLSICAICLKHWFGLLTTSAGYQKDVKLSKRCQMSNNETPRLWRRFTKKLNWHNEVHRYGRQFWHHKWWSLKTLKMFIESIFGQFWWPSYLTSKLMSICVNLIMSIYFFLWTSSIVQMFDFLTFGIFLTTWHLFDILTHQWNLNHLSPHRAIFYFPLLRLADFGAFWYCYNLWLLHVESVFCFIEKLTTKDCHSLSPQKNHRIGFLFSCLFSFLSYWCVSMVQISITENLSGYFNIYTTLSICAICLKHWFGLLTTSAGPMLTPRQLFRIRNC